MSSLKLKAVRVSSKPKRAFSSSMSGSRLDFDRWLILCNASLGVDVLFVEWEDSGSFERVLDGRWCENLLLNIVQDFDEVRKL